MNLRSIAHALGGEVSNGQVLAPGPGHSKRDRSLVGPTFAGRARWLPRVFVTPATTGATCRDYVRARLGIARRAPRTCPMMRQRLEPAAATTIASRDAARRLFAESVDPRGTLAERYLAQERGLPNVIDDVLALTLRFHPRCPFRDGDTLVRAPALIAALRDPQAAMHACSHLDEMDEIERRFLADPANVLAIQRIRLDETGRKVERRSLGPLENGVVFVSSIFEQFYSATATIAEGVESALAARKLGFPGVVAITGVLAAAHVRAAVHMGLNHRHAPKTTRHRKALGAPQLRAGATQDTECALSRRRRAKDANDYSKGAHHG